MNLSHQTVTEMIKLLENKGYISCLQSSRDKRCKNIKVTPRALELGKALKEVAISSEHLVVQDMSEDEQREFSRLLRTAHANMTGSVKPKRDLIND